MKTIFKYGILAAFFAVTNMASADIFDPEAFDFGVDGVVYNILSESDKTVEVTHGAAVWLGHRYYVTHQYKGDVVIPSTVVHNGVTYNVVAIGIAAFEPVSTQEYPQPLLSSISLPSSIKSIGKYAFKDCDNLTSLVIPEAITEIEEATFKGCSSLSILQFKGSLTKIGAAAFSGCTSLTSAPDLSHINKISANTFSGTAITSLNLPNSITEIGIDAFADCKYLKKVTIPTSVKILKGFSNCPNLSYIFIPGSVKNIGGFNNCPNLRINGLPSALDTIYANAFRNSGIVEAKVPASVRFIGIKALSECPYLSGIDVDSRNKKYSSRDGVLFNKNCDTLILYPSGSRVRYAYTIPSTVTFIGDCAFECTVGLTELTIPKTIKKIGRKAFYYMNNLCSVFCKAAAPVECTDLQDGMFNTIPKIPNLFVPKGSVPAYSKADRWRYSFENITDDIPDYIGIDSPQNETQDDISVDISEGTIYIKNAPANSISRVFSIQGGLIAETSGTEIQGLSPGVYVLAIGTKRMKLTVN